MTSRLILIFIFSTYLLFAQEVQKQYALPSVETLLQKAVAAKPTITAIPLEGAIDAEKYIVGPGDEITIGIWGAYSFTYPLDVTPEGTLIIPTVGEVKVASKSLDEVKRFVTKKVKEKYKNIEVSTTLTNPRSFIVQVTGVVANQSSYIVSSVTRVDKVILLANQTSLSSSNTLLVNPSDRNREELELDLQKMDPNKVEDILKRISTRNIRLIRKDGTEQKVDIPLFYATGEDKYNPFLQDGDRIIVPNKNIENDFISIYGEVNKQGAYEFVDGDDLKILIEIAGGLTRFADSSKIGIFRKSPGSTESKIISAILPYDSSLILKRGDQIVVNSFGTKPSNLIAYVTGEVKTPGVYPIERYESKLSEIIKLSGGFTKHADLFRAVLIRTHTEYEFVDKRFDLIQSLRSVDAKYMDSLYFFSEIDLKKRFVNADYVKLFVEKDSSADIYLTDGDIIYIPPINTNVYIFGQIRNPGYQPYNPNFTYKNYLAFAGGLTEKADKSEIKVIKAKTSQWLDPDKTKLDPGDAIWIPREIEKPFPYYFNLVRDGLGIVASLATVYLLINQLK